MGFRMEKFGAEEMEVELFLFAVLQICLLSPGEHRERRAVAVHRGTGSWRGSGCFISRVRTPRLGLVEQPCARGREALAEGAAWIPPVQESLWLGKLRTHPLSNRPHLTLLQCCITLECLWRGKRARGSWQLITSKPCAKASLLELSRKPFAQHATLWGHWGNFPIWSQGQLPKKAIPSPWKRGGYSGLRKSKHESSVISKYVSYGLNALHFCFQINISCKRKHCLSWKIRLSFPCAKVETFDNSKAFCKKLIQKQEASEE